MGRRIRYAGVAILFEASPGFQHCCHLGVYLSVEEVVAILFEASPGFQRVYPAMDRCRANKARSQSSLKRVLVSNLSDIRIAEHLAAVHASQSSLKRVLVSNLASAGGVTPWLTHPVAILFEASPGFQHGEKTDTDCVYPESQSSLKRVLVSNNDNEDPRKTSSRPPSQSSLKRVLVSNGVKLVACPTWPLLFVAILFEASPGFQPCPGA